MDHCIVVSTFYLSSPLELYMILNIFIFNILYYYVYQMIGAVVFNLMLLARL